MLETQDIFNLYDNITPELLENSVSNSNFLIEKGIENSDLTVIYFASNGIYFPNNDETFKNEIIEKNKFEFFQRRIVNAKEHIYVRDILKHFYVRGINKELDSANKLYEFLKERTKGQKIITVGSSAGGYAAVLFGLLLNAECIFTFSGIFDIRKNFLNEEQWNKYKLLSLYDNYEPINKYFNIVEKIEESNIPIFYLFPTGNHKDMIQYNLVKDFKNVYPFKIKSNEHGINFVSVKGLKEYLNSSICSLKLICNLCLHMSIPIKLLTILFDIKYMINRLLKRRVKL